MGFCMIGAVKRLKVTDYFTIRHGARVIAKRVAASTSHRQARPCPNEITAEVSEARKSLCLNTETPWQGDCLGVPGRSTAVRDGGLSGERGSVGRAEIAAPIFVRGDGEHGLELHLFIDLEGDGLRRVATAFAVVVLQLVPKGTGGTGAGGGLRFHRKENGFA